LEFCPVLRAWTQQNILACFVLELDNDKGLELCDWPDLLKTFPVALCEFGAKVITNNIERIFACKLKQKKNVEKCP
jgi:hypothetical protein